MAGTPPVSCGLELLARKGIPTHFLRREDETTIRVQECQVRDLPLVSGQAYADMVGLEILFRIRASKKFCDRVARGGVPSEKIYLPSGVELTPGVKFAKPFVEASTKWREGGDIYLTDEEAAALKASAASVQELVDIMARA